MFNIAGKILHSRGTKRLSAAFASSLLIAAICFFPATAKSAGNLALDATITSVTVRSSGSVRIMTLTLTGGSGPCSSVDFPDTGNATLNDGMRSVAMSAYLSGKLVRIYDYDGSGGTTDCTGADYIKLY